jgi:hypothetical protein
VINEKDNENGGQYRSEELHSIALHRRGIALHCIALLCIELNRIAFDSIQ